MGRSGCARRKARKRMAPPTEPTVTSAPTRAYCAAEKPRGCGGSLSGRGTHLGLEVLQGPGDVEDGLGPRADHAHGRAAELGEVGGDVQRGLPAPVHPADAPRHEHPHPRPVRQQHRARHRRRPVRALGHHPRQVPPRDLRHGTADARQSGRRRAAKRADRGRPLRPWLPPLPPRARLLRTLATWAPARARRSSCARERPTVGVPRRTATVAGTAPARRTMASTSSAVRRFSGYGIPWHTIVLSSATTARPAPTARATSSPSCTAPGVPS